jgi:hypothetical protein
LEVKALRHRPVAALPVPVNTWDVPQVMVWADAAGPHAAVKANDKKRKARRKDMRPASTAESALPNFS